MSKKKKNNTFRKIEKKPILDSRIIAVIGGVILFALIIYFLMPVKNDTWAVNDEGILHYPENRGKVDVKVEKIEKGTDYTLETISFPSKDFTVYGLLRIPASKEKVPGIVILPGATITKEGTQTLAVIFSDNGYASLGIDQRNQGVVNIKSDYELWTEGMEPVEHKMVFDALRAVDVLKQEPAVDPEKIAIVGESNGGRFAIIAAAIDPKISGVIGISTSGYDTESQVNEIRDESIIRFYRSVDPDTYLKFIPPRKFVMIHSDNDTIIPIQLARNTFMKALPPKQFYNVTTGSHGYSEGMKMPLETELKSILSQK